MRCTRKHIRRGVVAIFVGVVATVAVAWVSMALVHSKYVLLNAPTISLVSSKDGKNLWVLTSSTGELYRSFIYFDRTGTVEEFASQAGDRLPIVVEMDSISVHLRPQSHDGSGDFHNFCDVGWPLCSLTWSVHQEFDSVYVASPSGEYLHHRVHVAGAWHLNNDKEGVPNVLPFMPVVPGFIINTLFYATIWLGITLGIGAWRSRRRIRQNRCARCGYSREGLESASACPECGTLLTN
ncbi:MAG: hypothetical protein H6815_01760 [Phycisphaeraceae bacterium]|nr:hypothetical protein [Phycisphaerales bacterium]MCB9859154.1 hypothetical protein [Phycisphaeraceae bacterium]